MTYIGGETAYYQKPDPEPECRDCEGAGEVDCLEYAPYGQSVIFKEGCYRCGGSGVEPPTPDPRGY